MPNLDFALVYETQIRPRQRLRRLVFNTLILIVAAVPLVYVGVSGFA